MLNCVCRREGNLIWSVWEELVPFPPLLRQPAREIRLTGPEVIRTHKKHIAFFKAFTSFKKNPYAVRLSMSRQLIIELFFKKKGGMVLFNICPETAEQQGPFKVKLCPALALKIV